MSKLLELKTRIEKLPQLHKQKHNNAKVASFSARIRDAYSDVMDCVNKRNFFLAVFPEAKLKKTTDAVKQSKQQAARLIEKLKEDFDEIGKTETDKKITRMREKIIEASDQIRKEWRKRLEEELKPFAPLVEIVQEAGLPGHAKIVTTLDALNSKVSSPPVSIKEAEQVKNDLAFLRLSVGELDLEGPGGEFLRKAVRGRARAKDLLRKEVQDFLNEKDLWDILTIKVG